jgi:hypothetical protein
MCGSSFRCRRALGICQAKELRGYDHDFEGFDTARGKTPTHYWSPSTPFGGRYPSFAAYIKVMVGGSSKAFASDPNSGIA